MRRHTLLLSVINLYVEEVINKIKLLLTIIVQGERIRIPSKKKGILSQKRSGNWQSPRSLKK